MWDGYACEQSTGVEDSAFGLEALFSNTTGNENTANGSRALSSNSESLKQHRGQLQSPTASSSASRKSVSGSIASAASPKPEPPLLSGFNGITSSGGIRLSAVTARVLAR